MMTDMSRKPGVVGWEITSHCNLACSHCFSAAGRRVHNEPDEQFCKRMIDEMAALGVTTIGWTGGEPLLRSDLEELSAYAWRKGIMCTVTTNGVLLDERRVERLFVSGVRMIQISLDGSTAEANYRMRGTTEEEYGRILKAIRACKRQGVRLLMATLVGQENLADMPNMVALAKREGVDTIRFCAFTPVGRGRHFKVIERLEFTEKLRELRQFVEQCQVDDELIMTFDVGFGPVSPEYSFHRCVAGVETFYLKANGDVFPCTSLTDKRFCVGNARERKLAELWRDPEMARMAHFPLETIRGDCQECENFGNCRGACRGATYAHTRDLTASFPRCLYQVACKSPAAESRA